MTTEYSEANMNHFKSIFVSIFLAASAVGFLVSLVQLLQAGIESAWLGTAIACAGPALFFTRVFAFPPARTSRNLYPMLMAGIVGTALAGLIGGVGGVAFWLAFGVGVVGCLGYVFWYSRFAPPTGSVLREGTTLPDFQLQENGQTISREALTAQPALWIFFRGNWCPLCMAQIREVAAQYQALAQRGVQVLLVSPQPQGHTASLASRFQVPMRFLTDGGNAAAARLGILERGGLPAGMQMLGYDSDVPRPSVFITDARGQVIYCDLTDNYRVRPEPQQFLAVLDRHAIV